MSILAFLLLAAASQACGGDAPYDGPSNFVYFGRDHEPALDPAFLEAAGVDGAQLTFTWRELEPERGRYDFTEVERYRDVLGRHGKRLWIQLSDVTFTDRLPVPEYLRADTAYHGGAAR